MKRIKSVLGQSTIEFTFGIIVIMFLIYGMIQVFRWAGMDLAQRRYYQDTSILNIGSGNPESELNADDDIVVPMAAVYHGKITGNVMQ